MTDRLAITAIRVCELPTSSVTLYRFICPEHGTGVAVFDEAEAMRHAVLHGRARHWISGYGVVRELPGVLLSEPRSLPDFDLWGARPLSEALPGHVVVVHVSDMTDRDRRN